MPVVVTPDQVDQPCTEMWADPETFATTQEVCVEDAETAIIEATWLLWTLTFHRFHGYQCWVEDYRINRGRCQIQLEQWPVEEVLSVSTVDVCADDFSATGIGTEIDGWCYAQGGLVRVCSNTAIGDCMPPSHCLCSQSVVRVQYRTKPNLPPGADRVVKKLAAEHVKAASGKPCMLPERITNITRNGGSWVLLDPMDFLEKGLTGVGSVDNWISAANGRGVMRLIDPLMRPPLVSSTLVGCGTGCLE